MTSETVSPPSPLRSQMSRIAPRTSGTAIVSPAFVSVTRRGRGDAGVPGVSEGGSCVAVKRSAGATRLWRANLVFMVLNWKALVKGAEWGN